MLLIISLPNEKAGTLFSSKIQAYLGENLGKVVSKASQYCLQDERIKEKHKNSCTFLELTGSSERPLPHEFI